MILSDVVLLSLRNLRQAKLRTALTTLGVSIGIASLVGMVSLGVGLQELTVGRFMRSGIFDSITVSSREFMGGVRRAGRARPPSSSSSATQSSDAKVGGSTSGPAEEEKAAVLDDAALEKMAALPYVKEVYPNLRVPVEFQYRTFAEFVSASGVPLSMRGEGFFQSVKYGQFFSSADAQECILVLDFAKRVTKSEDPKNLIGEEVMLNYLTSGGSSNPLGGMMGSPLSAITVQRVEKKFRVVGIIEREPGPNFSTLSFSNVFMTLTKAKEAGAQNFSNPQALLRGLARKSSYTSATVKIVHPKRTDAVEKKIKEMGFNAFSINDALENAKKAFLILDIVLGLVGSIALAVASLGIVNTMVMSILERTHEIGIMKAIGGSDADIKQIFFVEASTIGAFGGAWGVALGWAVGKIINVGANLYIVQQGGTAEQLFFIPWWLALGGVGFAVLVSWVAGLYPASRAARIDPVQALRHN